MNNDQVQLKALPKSIISPSDLISLTRELIKIDRDINQAHLHRTKVELMAKDVSPSLLEVLILNKKDILKAEDRQQCLNYLDMVIKKAPKLHFSFASEPNQEVTNKLVDWLRGQIHPLCLVVIGMAPGIGAGCYVWTDKHLYDFTLKTKLVSSRQDLVNKVKESIASPKTAQPA